MAQTEAQHAANTATKHTGACHCGAVRYEVELDLGTGVSRCNCSVCTKVSPMGAMVKPAAFKLVAGEADLSTYVWGAKMSRRFFCKHCGVHCYGSGHLAELGGDFVSVNVNTVENIEPSALKVIYWDGRHDNWQVGPRDRAWPMQS